MGTVYHKGDCRKQKRNVVSVKINVHPIKMMIDCGAAVSCISESQAEQIGLSWSKSETQLSAYGGTKLEVCGEIQTSIERSSYKNLGKLFIVKNVEKPLLGRSWFPLLGIQIHMLATVNAPESIVVTLNAEQSTSPVVAKARPLPFSLMPVVKQKLDDLKERGIIEEVEQPIWSSPIVVVKKANGVDYRICGDFRRVNQHLIQPPISMPTRDDILVNINNCKKFSVLDLKEAYHNLALDEKSKDFTTIVTPFGAFRYRYLPYGLSPAPTIFQTVLTQLLKGIPGVVVFIDDILVAAENESVLKTRVAEILKRLREKNIMLNLSKCVNNKSEVEFLSLNISTNGVKMSGDKTDAVRLMKDPENKTELQQFLGLLNFYAPFMDNVAMTTAPLYDLLKKDVPWKWETKHSVLISKLKEEMLSERVLAPYDPAGPLTLTTDGSPVGIGGALEQNGRPVALVSRKLTYTESRYPQIEREALAIVWCVKRLNRYLAYRSFKIITDHKPLEYLFDPHKNLPEKATKRIEGWVEMLSRYKYEISGKRTNAIPHADALSRLPVNGNHHADIAANAVHEVFGLDLALTAAMAFSRQDLENATDNDPELQNVIHALQKGHKLPQPFSKYENRLSIESKLLCLDDRVVVPQIYRVDVLKFLHASHPGIQTMKFLAKAQVWWPYITSDIELVVKKCEPCMRVRPSQAPVLKPWPEPKETWARVHADLGHFRGKDLLIVCDAKSAFIAAEYMRSLDSKHIILALRRIFCNFGLPTLLVTDNGRQFVSEEFTLWLKQIGIQHLTSPRYHPASNGVAEAAVKRLKTKLNQLDAEKNDELRLQQAFYALRVTPRADGPAPATTMFGREFNTRLTLLTKTHWKPENQEVAKESPIWHQDPFSRVEGRSVARSCRRSAV